MRGERLAGPIVQTILEWRKAMYLYIPTLHHKGKAHTVTRRGVFYVEIFGPANGAGTCPSAAGGPRDDTVHVGIRQLAQSTFRLLVDRKIGNDVQKHGNAFVEGSDRQPLVVAVHAL